MKLKNALFRIQRAATRGILFCLPDAFVAPLADIMLSTRNRLLERLRQIESGKRGDSGVAHLKDHRGVSLDRRILHRTEPWAHLKPPSSVAPGMLTDAEKRYYRYITQFVDDAGVVLEVGTWLGMSTFHIAMGLRENPRFTGKMICIDDFVWRSSSMNKWVAGSDLDPPGNYESFQPLFQRFLEESGIDDLVETRRMKVADYFGNESVPLLSWDGESIELCIIDCGRTLEVNNGWYRTLAPSFIPDKTLIVMQDWQNHKIVPERFWENTRIFTEGKGDALDLVHEVRDAGIATFLYRGDE